MDKEIHDLTRELEQNSTTNMQQPEAKDSKKVELLKSPLLIIGVIAFFFVGAIVLFIFRDFPKSVEITPGVEEDRQEKIENERTTLVLESGRTLTIEVSDEKQNGATTQDYSVIPSYSYFKDLESMTYEYLGLGKTWYEGVESSYPENIVIDGVEYEYLFKIDGDLLAGAGIGAVYQWDPTIEVHEYEFARIHYYYNSPYEGSLASKGYYPQDHEMAGKLYTSGEFTGEETSNIFCILDLNTVFEQEAGFLVFDAGDLNNNMDNCETIENLEKMTLFIE